MSDETIIKSKSVVVLHVINAWAFSLICLTLIRVLPHALTARSQIKKPH